MNVEEPPSPTSSWLDTLKNVLSPAIEPTDSKTLLQLIRTAHQHGVMRTDALEMIEGVLEVAEEKVREVMVPRGQMIVIQDDQLPEDFLSLITESGHSRFPVIDDSKDNVQGILIAKDLIQYFAQKADNPDLDFNMRDWIRQPVFIPESKRLNVLLHDFRTNRNHMAIVVDEYGGVAGLVTIEDVLEEIIGDIDDEHDTTEGNVYIKKRAKGHAIVRALTPIEHFNAYFSTQISDEECDTIGGFLMQHFGRLPKRGESVELVGLRFEVVRANNRRIHMLRVYPNEPQPSSASSD